MTDYAIRTGLKILPQAWHDLLEIGFVYSRQGKRLEASAVTCSIVSKLKELQDFAMLGNKTPLSSLNEKKYLMLMIDKYACIYRKVENTVYIYHITELQRDYPNEMTAGSFCLQRKLFYYFPARVFYSSFTYFRV